MKIVLCIEKLTVERKLPSKSITFIEGMAYYAEKVNEKYWVVDSIGIKAEDFPMYFEVQDELVKKGDKSSEGVSKRFVEEEAAFKELLNSFGGFDDEDEKKEEKYPWYVRWTSSFILWQNYEQ